MRHDMTTYFDAVLDGDMSPLVNGSPEEVLLWLDRRPLIQERDDLQVCVGRTMQLMTVEEYLQQFG